MCPNPNSEPHEIVIRVRGLRLAAKCWGPRESRKVLALHGWMDNAGSYDQLAPALIAGGLDVHIVALDLPGCGMSDHRPPQASYEFVEWIPDVVGAVDALGWHRFAVMGHSLGAAIATCVAAAVPKQVERAVLFDGLGPLSAASDQVAAQLAAAVDQRRHRLSSRSHVYPHRDRAIERILQLNRALTPQAARALVARGVREVDGGVVWAHDVRLRERSLVRLTEDQVLGLIAAVRCPVLFVRASDGWPMDEALLRARIDRLHDVKLVEVEGGHHVHLTHPERLTTAVKDFLART